MAKLKRKDFLYVTNKTSGFTRSKEKDSFVYLDLTGKKIKNKKKIKRIEKLVIPPSWKDVWIAPDKKMHIQSYGYDLSGKKQYIYHTEWVALNDFEKFSKLTDFGVSLPRLRQYTTKHLKRKKWGKKKAAALAVTLMDKHYLRVGNKKYALDNDTFGISTLNIKHIDRSGKKFNISYKAKGNKKRKIKVGSRKIQELLLDISEIPGKHIFQYYGRGGKKYVMNSGQINRYIKKYAQGKFTAKDFRTWGATSLTVKYYKKAVKDCKKNRRLKLESSVVRYVADKLGNKVSTSRDYYIHPKVLEVVANKDLGRFEKVSLPSVSYKRLLKKHEIKTLKVLYSN